MSGIVMEAKDELKKDGKQELRDSLTPKISFKDLQKIRDRIVNAKLPEAVYGELGGANTEKLAALNTKHFKLIKVCKSYLTSKNETELEVAKEVFTGLTELYRSAQESIRNGSYGTNLAIVKAAEKSKLGVIEGNKYTYALTQLLAEGDLALVYRASYQDEKGVALEACVKIAKDKINNDLIKNEQTILASLDHASIPKLIETIELPDGKLATTLNFIDGFNFHQLRETPMHAVGLKDANYHIGWILERQLAVLGYLHSKGIVHGSVEPAHLLIQPQTHNVVLIDFCWAIKNPTKENHIKIAQEFYSAPEIYSKAQPEPSMDIYGLGKSAAYLLGSDPENVALNSSIHKMYHTFIERMIEEDPKIRAKDAYQLAYHLLAIRDEVSGNSRTFKSLPGFEVKGKESDKKRIKKK